MVDKNITKETIVSYKVNDLRCCCLYNGIINNILVIQDFGELFIYYSNEGNI